MKNFVRSSIVIVSLLLAVASAASAESGFLDLSSPQFVGGNGGTATDDSPMGTLLNPSISADRQRTTFDLSYLALTQLTPGFSWGGNVVNLGLTWPTRVGVLTGIARFANADFPGTGLDWGSQGSLNVSFSKDLFPDLYIGAGLGFQFGSDWGLGLDLGFTSLVGDLGFMKDFRWGGAIRDIGKGYGTSSTAGSLGNPTPFTPAVGASFLLVKTDSLQLGISPDLSFPSFQDIRGSLGIDFTVADMFSLSLGGVLDLRQLLGVEPSRSLPLQFGMSLRLNGLGVKTGGQDVTEIRTSISATPLTSGVWAFGSGITVPIGVRDVTAPSITIDTTGEKYISPNFDGIKDDLILTLAITDDRYVKGFTFTITDDKGAVVRTIQNKEDRPENADFQNILSRLAYVKTGIAIPDSLRWDGKSDAGVVVPDGTYHYQVEAWDDNNNRGKSGLGTVVVDVTPPAVTASAPYLIFSPDGDSNKDTLPIAQTGSSEDVWTGTIRTIAGDTVRTYTWKNSAPPSFEWDGKTDPGTFAPDGVYSYSVTATDRAGNAGTAQLDNIIIDTRPTPVGLTIDLSFFSPNGDGVKDTVTFTPQVPVATGIETWSLAIADEKGAARRTISGKLSIPAAIPWDGKDDAGVLLPEGAYIGTLTVLYVNGKNPKASSPSVTIDVTAPRAAAKAEYDVFSPNGDGNKDTVTIFQDTSDELFWTGTIRNSAGKDVKSMVWRGRADDKWVWDGKGDDGSLLPDGTYVYSMTSTDRAGNSVTSTPISIRIDTEETPVRVSADPVYFSPNGDGGLLDVQDQERGGSRGSDIHRTQQVP